MASSKDDDVYARILQRIERDELHKQCRRVVRRDAKCLHKTTTQLHDAFHRLRAVDTAVRQLRQKHSHSSSRDERMEAQIREIEALRARLAASLDALGQPVVVKDCDAHKDHGWESRQHIKEPSNTAVAKAEPLLKVCKLDPSAQVKQELIASAATDIDTKPALQHSNESSTPYKDACAGLPPVECSIQPLVTLELELDDADPSARAPTCLDDAQRLAHASLETQSYQFPFLVAKVRAYLSARTHLDAAEAREIAQALEIAASIGATVASHAPNEPALAELLYTIDAFHALAGDDAPRVTTANMTKFAASCRPHPLTADAVHRDPHVAQEGDDVVICVDV